MGLTDHQLTEVRENQDRYRVTLEALPDAVVMYDLQGRVEYANPAFTQMFGWSADELLGKRVDFVPEDQKQITSDGLKTLFQQGKVEATDTRRLTKDGRLLDVQASAALYKDESGKPSGSVVIFREITERKRAERALVQERNQLRTLIDNLPDSIFFKDRESRFVLNNRVHLQLSGVDTQEEVLGKTDLDVFQRELAEGYYADEQALMATGEALVNREEPVVDQQGNKHWALTTKVPLRDAEGNVTGLVGISRDITDRKRAEEELARSRELLQLVMDTIPQSIFWKDRDSRFSGCNRQFASDLNLPSHEWLIGKTDFDLSSAANAEEYRAIDRRVMEADAPELNFEEPQTRPDGSIAWLRTSKAPLHDAVGAVVGVLVMYEDITERKLAEQERERMIKELQVANAKVLEASRLKSEFLATMSHELRTPLNAVIGFSGIMLEGIAGQIDSQARYMVQAIYDSSQNLLRLINDVLDLSKIEAGRMELVVAPLSIAELVEQWESQMSVIAQRKQLPFDVEVAPEVPATLYGDQARLHQIVVNLLSNAFKFTEKGEVRLGITWERESLIIRVFDTGVGIPPHALNYIFDEFRQVDSSSQRMHSGTGLGLAIVRRLCLMMSGTAQVSSKLGEGSVFTVTLPLRPHEEG